MRGEPTLNDELWYEQWREDPTIAQQATPSLRDEIQGVLYDHFDTHLGCGPECSHREAGEKVISAIVAAIERRLPEEKQFMATINSVNSIPSAWTYGGYEGYNAYRTAVLEMLRGEE